MIDIVIPVQRVTKQLETTVATLTKYKNNVATRLHIIERDDWNVSEARQDALANPLIGPYICYLDDDSEMIHDHWLDEMFYIMQNAPDAGIIFGGEWWGTEEPPRIVNYSHFLDCSQNAAGPAACMLIDQRKFSPFVKWDQHIGLRSGWLGGDFEEVDFCHRVLRDGYKLYHSTGTLFHHTGGKTTHAAFSHTDRVVCIRMMFNLIGAKYLYDASARDEDFFKGLKYVKADSIDDCMLAPGETLRECYVNVLRRNGLCDHAQFQLIL